MVNWESAKSSMRIYFYGILLILGSSHIVIGAILGRLRIYALIAPLLHELNLTKDQIRIFSRFMDEIVNQWQLVFWSGIVTVLVIFFLLLDDRYSRRK